MAYRWYLTSGEWFEDYAKIKVRPTSHQTYRGYIDNHINQNIGEIPMEKLTSLELQKLYKHISGLAFPITSRSIIGTMIRPTIPLYRSNGSSFMN